MEEHICIYQIKAFYPEGKMYSCKLMIKTDNPTKKRAVNLYRLFSNGYIQMANNHIKSTHYYYLPRNNANKHNEMLFCIH